jgi:hypothetical protein
MTAEQNCANMHYITFALRAEVGLTIAVACLAIVEPLRYISGSCDKVHTHT